MLGTVNDAVLFVQRRLGEASPRAFQIEVVNRFIGVGQITWLGLSNDGTVSTFPRDVLELKRGLGVKGDWRCHSSPKMRPLNSLLKLFAPGVSSINSRQVVMVCEEDDKFIDERDQRPPGKTVRAGEQGENIRLTGLNLAEVPFGSTLLFISPAGEVSPATLFGTGSHANTLTFMVQSSGRLGNTIEVGWFVAVFRDKI